MKKMHLSLEEIYQFSESKDQSLLGDQVAGRDKAWDFNPWGEMLPNPDPVLRNLEDGGLEVLEGLTADAHVMSVIQTRKLGTLRREFSYKAGNKIGQKSTKADEAIWKQLQNDFEQMDLYNVISQILDAPYYGMAPLELMWEPKPSGFGLKEIRPLPARWFAFDADNQPKFLSKENPWAGQSLPWGKFIFARHFPSYDNPYGLRLLSRCLWPTSFKKGGIKFWVMLSEKYGVPFLLGKYAAGTSEKEQQDLLNNLAKAVRDAVLVVPESSKIEILEASKAQGSSALHRELVNSMNIEISKVILGQNLTTEVKGGSFAASKAHMGVLEAYLEADQKMVAAVMNQIAQVYTQINDPSAAPPKFGWFDEEQSLQKKLERDQALKSLGAVFSKDYLQKNYQLPQNTLL